MSDITVKFADGLDIHIVPDEAHEFLMTTDEVAAGYGVAPVAIRSHKSRYAEELIEGKHWFTSVAICNARPNPRKTQVFWTKRGIVRLGFFIKSERARMFRDWAEDFIARPRQQPKQLPMPDTVQELVGQIGSLKHQLGNLHIQVEHLKQLPHPGLREHTSDLDYSKFTIQDYAKLRGYGLLPTSDARSLGRAARRLTLELGRTLTKIPNPNPAYEKGVSVWSGDVLAQVFAEWEAARREAA